MKKFLPSRLEISPQAENVLKADAPPALKISAAKGLLPLPPKELITLQFALLEDSAPEIQAAAEEALKGYPKSILLPNLGGDIHQKIIDWFVRNADLDSELQEAIALNKNTADETIALLAQVEDEKLSEIIANNQERYTRFPKIAENLFDNNSLNLAVKNRVLSFYHAKFFGMDEEEEKKDKAEEETKPVEQSGPVSLAMLEEEEEEEVPEDLKGGLELGEVPDELMTDAGEEEDIPEDKKLSIYGQILTMNVSAKIKLALKGNKEARSILIKEPNRLVSVAVVQSPKITVNEIAAIANNKTVDDEVIRIITRNKDWMRSYQIKLSLAQNPKTPFRTALGYLSQLREGDVKAIAKSKNVPPAIAQAAFRMSIPKEKRKKK